MTRKSYSKKDREMALGGYYDEKDKSNFISFLISDNKLEELGLKRFKIPEGVNYIAILPREDDPKFFEEVWVHYNVGDGSYLCPSKMYGENCPVCNYRKELESAGEDFEVTKSYYPSRRYIMFIVDMKDEKSLESGVQIIDAPKTILDEIADLTRDERSGDIFDLSDPDEEKMLSFRRKGTDFKTKYTGFKIKEISYDIPDEYFENLPEMSKLFIAPDITAMKKAMGTIPADVPEDEEPIRSRRKSVEEDNEYEEEKPVSKRRKIKRNPIEEDEDQEKENARTSVRNSIRKKRLVRETLGENDDD